MNENQPITILCTNSTLELPLMFEQATPVFGQPRIRATSFQHLFTKQVEQQVDTFEQQAQEAQKAHS